MGKYGGWSITSHPNSLTFSRVHYAQCGFALSCCRMTHFLLINAEFFTIKVCINSLPRFQQFKTNNSASIGTKHTEASFWDDNPALRYFVVIHLEESLFFAFGLSYMIRLQWSSNQITILYFAVEAICCMWWIGFVIFRHYGRPKYLFYLFFQSDANVLGWSTKVG